MDILNTIEPSQLERMRFFRSDHMIRQYLHYKASGGKLDLGIPLWESKGYQLHYNKFWYDKLTDQEGHYVLWLVDERASSWNTSTSVIEELMKKLKCHFSMVNAEPMQSEPQLKHAHLIKLK